MANLIACRIGSYGPYEQRGWSHLREIGIRHVEVPVPSAQQIDALRQKLKAHDLGVSSMQGTCEVAREDVADSMRAQFRTCADFGARICFVSVKAGEVDRRVVWERLRAVGDAAAQSGITLVLETHPDLVTNGDIGRQTMESIRHSNVRVNFDTANVHYYNRGVSSVAELKKVIDYVAAVHLKDTRGGYHDFNFPPLGQGAVEFPEIFRLLGERGFHGPYTMELERPGENEPESVYVDAVAESVTYLRKIGVMK